MFGLPRSHSSSQSWFALKKEEFYVILDTVLTEMTSQCEEKQQRDVTGCMELIKLLNDTDTNREVGTKNAQNGSSNKNMTNVAKGETETRKAEVVVGERRFRSRGGLEASSGRKDDRPKSDFDRSADENSQLSDRVLNYSKISEDHCNERRQCLRRSKCGSQNLEPNRISGTPPPPPGRTDFNSRTSCKGSSTPCLYLKRPLTEVPDAAKTTDWTRRSYDRHHHHHHRRRTDVSKSVSSQSLSRMCVPSPIRFDGRTRNRGVVSAPSSSCRAFEMAPKQKLRSQNRPADDSGSISPEVSNSEQEPENYVWTAVDKSVINGIVDSLLLLDPSVKKSCVTHDVKPCHALSSVLGSSKSRRVKTEDVVSDDAVTPPRKVNNDDVNLHDVTRFDVTEMGFKWKSKLLWRMNRDGASRSYPSKLCMT